MRATISVVALGAHHYSPQALASTTVTATGRHQKVHIHIPYLGAITWGQLRYTRKVGLQIEVPPEGPVKRTANVLANPATSNFTITNPVH